MLRALAGLFWDDPKPFAGFLAWHCSLTPLMLALWCEDKLACKALLQPLECFFFLVSSARISIHEHLMLFRTPLRWVGLFSKQAAECISCGNLTAVTRKSVICSCYCLMLVPIKCSWTSESRVDARSRGEGGAPPRVSRSMALGSLALFDLWRMEGVPSQWGNHTCAQCTLGTGVVKGIGILNTPGDGRDTVGSV